MKTKFFSFQVGLIVLCLIFSVCIINAQNVAITDDETYIADSSAMLDIYSESKGILIPRLDSAHRVDMTFPAKGLLVFDTTKVAFFYYNGDDWLNLTTNVIGPASAGINLALFSVVNNAGDTVFAVYPEGVRINVGDGSAKGHKGGFAVSGKSTGKDFDEEYFRVTNDSVRIYVDTASSKANKGGFAVGGLNSGKNNGKKFLTVSNDSVRVYIEKGVGKANKGGFAVGGLNSGKADLDEYLRISSNTAVDTINPSEARILWYPEKEAFLTGKVLIEDIDSVGTNSMATGFESKSIGDFSQAMGYKSIARGTYATAIGREAEADTNSYAFGYLAKAIGHDAVAIGTGAYAIGEKSFAFGSVGIDTLDNVTGNTIAIGDNSYALGLGSYSSGRGAFAIGANDTASGKFSLAMGYETTASTKYSTAIGFKSNTSGNYSVALGTFLTSNGFASLAMVDQSEASGSRAVAIGYKDTASGSYSTAIGLGAKASGFTSTAIGDHTIASAFNATAIGYYTKASGGYSTATGYHTTALGSRSTALGAATIARGIKSTSCGDNTIARSFSCFVIGRYNDTLTTSSTDSWGNSDPLFIIGNGWSEENRRNAMSVLKNGNVGIGTTSPSGKFHVVSDVDATTDSSFIVLDNANVGIGTINQFGSGSGILSIGNASTAPTTTLTNAAALYSASGELYSYDAAGNATQISPHDSETGEWIFYSKNTKTGRVVRINMEQLVKKVEELTGESFMEEWIEE